MNAKKLLSTLLSAAMAVSMLAGCFGGGGNKNYSDEAADAANAAQNTVVFSTDATLAKSLQDALADGLTQLDEIDDAMEADENLKPLLTSGWDLDIFAAQGEDAEAAAKTIAEQYIVSAVIGKKAEGKIAMVLHDGNGYYYVAVLTYGNGGGAGGGSGSGEGGQGGGTTPGTDPDEPGPDDDENNPGGGDDDVIYYSVTTNAQGGNGHYNTPSRVEKGQELSFTVTADEGYEAVVTATMGGEPIVLIVNGNRYTYGPVTDDIVIDITFAKKAPEQFILNMGVNDVDGGKVYADIDGDGTEEDFLGDTFVTAGEDFTFTVTPNDFIILSASPIPGNEESVTRVINALLRQGAEVIYEKTYDLHTSGHAQQDELKLMLALTKPRFFMPVHGEYKHLKKHCDLAAAMGVPRENMVIGEIGRVVELSPEQIALGGTVPSGSVMVDGLGVGDVGSIVLRDRKHLAQDGLIIVVVAMDSATGEVVSGPDIVSRGFVYVREAEDMMSDARRVCLRAVDRCREQEVQDWGSIKNAIKDQLGQFVWGRTKRSPMILPIIQEV